jgi:hypothetical protein
MRHYKAKQSVKKARDRDKTIRKYTDFDELKAEETATGRAARCMSGGPPPKN